MAALAHAMGSVGGPPVRMVLEGEQGGRVRVGDQPDIAAPAAVAAIGSAFGDVSLPPERDRAGAPVARLHVQLCLVDEPGHGSTSLESLVLDGLVSGAVGAVVSGAPSTLYPVL